jgi:hypothetical protein
VTASEAKNAEVVFHTAAEDWVTRKLRCASDFLNIARPIGLQQSQMSRTSRQGDAINEAAVDDAGPA